MATGRKGGRKVERENIPATRIPRVWVTVGRPTLDDTIATPAWRAVGRSTPDRGRDSGSVDALGKWHRTCGGAEGVGELAVCVADALLAYGFVVLLEGKRVVSACRWDRLGW